MCIRGLAAPYGGASRPPETPPMLAALFAAAAIAAAPAPLDPAAVRAIEAVAYDYVDGQLEGDPARVARSLHPDLAKRAVKTDPDETLALRRMSKDELVE